MTTCPKCGYERKAADNAVNPGECPRCHIIYAKWKKVADSPPAAPSKSPPVAARSANVENLVYKHEPTLFAIHVGLSSLFWLGLVLMSKGVVLVYILGFFISYLFVQSGLISHLKGNGVKLSHEQFPGLYKRYVECCNKLGLSDYPDVYLVNSNGILNAFASRFLGRNFVVLFSSVVEGLANKQDAIQFYIGHELGHIKRNHLQWGPFLWPTSFWPLIGAAYSRACEYTCDQYGLACCENPESALHGLIALSAGEKLWTAVDIPAYLKQVEESSGFWMSFHELISDYPWLVKRAARMYNPYEVLPSRDIFAWVLAVFVPRFGYGGSAAGALVSVAIVGILAAIAVPQFTQYKARAQAQEADRGGEQRMRPALHIPRFR